MNTSRPFPREPHITRYYRLRAALPLTVSFPSVVYRLEFGQVIGAPTWSLDAKSLAGRPSWTLAHHGCELALLTDVYLCGFDILHPTAASAIMERLCAESRAERTTKQLASQFWAFIG